MDRITPARIRQIREALGESQVAFGKRIGAQNNSVSRWELGLKTPEDYHHVKALIELDEQLSEQEKQRP